MSDPPPPSPPLDACPRCSAPLVPGMVICPDCEIPLADLCSATTGPLDPRGQLPASLDSGQSLGDRYTIVERVGAGGMGLIYKALDRKLGRSVALKMIQAGVAERPGARERFKREILLAQQVSHPNVCRLHDLGEFQGQPFISMEYVEGQTLETLIQSMGHLSPSQTVSLAKQICAGLSAIHQRGIVHRDLKPANVMVDRLGHVVLMDFGMAYHEDQERLTQAGAVFGTLGYLAPEQMRGRPEPRSDLYALGLILYEMLTGLRPPGDGDALPLALREKGEACPPPSHFSPEVPAALDQLVLRCLEREPDKRYASSSELGEVLQQFEGPLTRSGILTREATLPPSTGRRRTVWLLAGAAVLAAIVALLVAGRRQPAAPSGPPSLAFLPLAHTGAPEEAYLKDLLPLVLSQELQGTPGLTVTPFAVSRTFGTQEDPRAVAQQLGVSLVVVGSVGDAGAGTRRLGLRAIGSDGRPRWTHEETGTPAALLQNMAKVARTLAHAQALPEKPAGPTRSAAALRRYLEGTKLLEGWDEPQSTSGAIRAFEAALEDSPDFAEAQAGLAQAYLLGYEEQRDPSLVEKAGRAAAEAVRLAPSLPEARLAQGLVHVVRGRSVEARLELQQAQELAPGDDTICRRIALAYTNSNRPAEAERLLNQAIQLRPQYWDNYNSLGIHLLRAGRLSEAISAFRKVVELRPEGDTGYSNLGGALVMAGHLSEAEPFLLGAMKMRPTFALHNNLGFVYYATGRFELAAGEWEAAIRGGSTRAESYSNLGDAYRQLGRQTDASASYRKAAELWRSRLDVNPSDSAARAAMAMALAGLADCAGASDQIRRATPDVDQSPSAAYWAALASALCRNQKDAVRFTLIAVRGGALADVRSNPDLVTVRRDPAIRSLLEGTGPLPN